MNRGSEVELYLVRHGEAVREDQNPERPLTDAGEETVRRLGAFLSRGRAVTVGEVRHSGKLRARQTAEILARNCGITAPICAAPNLAPLADVAGLVAELERAEENLMLVGHLPHLSRLASALIGAAPELEAFDFEAGAMLCLRSAPGRAASGVGRVWTVGWMLAPSLFA